VECLNIQQGKYVGYFGWIFNFVEFWILRVASWHLSHGVRAALRRKYWSYRLESCMSSMQCNVDLGTNSAFTLEPRKIAQSLDRFDRLQRLSEAYWLLALWEHLSGQCFPTSETALLCLQVSRLRPLVLLTRVALR